MDVSIIIVNYNTKQITEDCIDSIKEKTEGVKYEIILVDNASTDGSVEHFSNREDITFLPQQTNLGFGKANNKGIEVASGKYIFFLNSDTILLNNAVKEFYDYAECHQDGVGAIGCLLTGPDGNRAHSFASFKSATRVITNRLLSPFYTLIGKKFNYLDNDSLIHEGAFQVDYVTGADLFVRKTVIDKYGAFDPDFFMYFEETEMQHRWTKEGYPSFIITTPQIIHLEGATVKTDNNAGRNIRKMFMVQESQFLFYKKKMASLPYYLFRIAFLIIRLPFFFSGTLNREQKKQYFKILTRI